MKNLDSFYKEIEESHGKRTADAARELHTLYDEKIYKWLASLWDGEIGGFYYATSSRVTDGFLPDSESTMQAIGLLRTTGMIGEYSDLPEGMKKKLGNFAKKLQDPDGYFYHPQWKEMMLERPERFNSRRGRDLGQCTWLVRTIAGMETTYPTAS